jgi:hypothetical protein
MSEQQPSTPETYVDIKESYVDEKLREFFETEKNEVNIDNICLFSTMIVEEYNKLSEHKLKGQQKFEAATDLAKRIIEKTVTFVTEDHRRQVVKNIYYNIDAIPQTIQFICRISGNPNLVNADKWILNKVKKVSETVKESKSFLSKILCCTKKAQEPLEAPAAEPVVETPPVDKKKLKQEEKRRLAEEKLQRELEEIRMTPEEKEARAKAAKEAKIQAKKDKEEQVKAAKEAKIQAKKDLEEQKRLEKIKQKEKELQEALNKLKEEVKEAPIAEAPTAEAPTAEAPTAEAPTAEAPTAEAQVEIQEIEMEDMAVGA